MNSLKNHRKAWILAGMVLILTALVWQFFHERGEARAVCIQAIDYLGGNNSYRLIERKFEDAPRFKTHDEAMTYCLQELRSTN